VGLVSELMAGNLYDAIHNDSARVTLSPHSFGWPAGPGAGPLTRLTMVQKLWLMWQMAIAVDHLHAQGIMHLDLNSFNILVSHSTAGRIFSPPRAVVCRCR
jgi:serine/threonine protein kinase